MEIFGPAMQILDDDDREFVSSDFVRLEVSPKAVYHRQGTEVAFYAAFFDTVSVWVPPSETLVHNAYELACQFGLNALDALHVAAARLSRCDDLVTTERPGKPIYRVNGLQLVSIYPAADHHV